MYIDLTKLSEGIKQFDETIQIDLDEESARLTEPCRIFGELKKGIIQVEVTGNLNTNIEMDCSRCLSSVNTSLKIPVKVSFITEEFYTKEKDSELHGDDLEISIYDGEKIDLSDLVREQILLNLPTQIFCQENCQGLRLQCRANLNQKPCNCETKEIDPRWAKLKNLK